MSKTSKGNNKNKIDFWTSVLLQSLLSIKKKKRTRKKEKHNRSQFERVEAVANKFEIFGSHF